LNFGSRLHRYLREYKRKVRARLRRRSRATVVRATTLVIRSELIDDFGGPIVDRPGQGGRQSKN
jgi:hypothetical protein